MAIRKHAAGLALAWALVGLCFTSNPGRASAADDADAVSILDAQRDGLIKVVARGHGQSEVKFSVKNTSPRRLKIVVPPGLVAAATVSQGFQSMGLGGLSDQPGRFGRPQPTLADVSGFRSVPTAASTDSIDLSADQSAEFVMPSVCLNFGIPTPTSKNTFVLKDVSEYTNDPRAIKALRSLVQLGTSQGVAQAVAWNVFNNMTFEQVAKQGREYVNMAEVSLAARFVEALDASSGHDLVDSAYLRNGRILIRTHGESSMGKVADRLATELAGQSLFGLPIETVTELSAEHARPATLFVDAAIIGQGDRTNQTRVRANLRYQSAINGWTRLTQVDLLVPESPTNINGAAFARALDQAIANAAVTTTVARRANGSTTLKVVNRLPFTLNDVVLRTGQSEGAPEVTLDGIGIGPGRSAMAGIPAPMGLVERVTVNGL